MASIKDILAETVKAVNALVPKSDEARRIQKLVADRESADVAARQASLIGATQQTQVSR